MPGAVRWTSTASAEPTPTRVLPDGCLDLLWSSRSGLLVAGPDTGPHLSRSVPGDRWAGLRLSPGMGPAVFGLPAHELRDQRVPLGDVWPRRRLGELLEQAEVDPVATLESVVAQRLRAGSGPAPLAAEVARRLGAGEQVAVVADAVGLSVRHLHRRCQDLFGYGPKTLARILRFTGAVALARTGVPLAWVAARAGYADQAHLTREVRALAGVSPVELLNAG